MANLDEAFQTFDRFTASRMREPRTISYEITYDTTCPTCGNHGYCATNDGGSIGGCTKCNTTYRSKAYNTEIITDKGIVISRRKMEEIKKEKDEKRKRCKHCGLYENNHNVYHLFEPQH